MTTRKWAATVYSILIEYYDFVNFPNAIYCRVCMIKSRTACVKDNQQMKFAAEISQANYLECKLAVARRLGLTQETNACIYQVEPPAPLSAGLQWQAMLSKMHKPQWQFLQNEYYLTKTFLTESNLLHWIWVLNKMAFPLDNHYGNYNYYGN